MTWISVVYVAFSGPQLEDLNLQDNSSDSDSYGSDDALGSSSSSRHLYNYDSLQSSSKSLRALDSHSSAQSESDLVGPVPQPASLHRPVSYNDMKKEQTEKCRRAGALGTLDQKKHRYIIS